ncbi:MAG: phosphoribosylanthranilate isomerase, partial [Synergistaceae bacterium]|nr:phosphoribosylanthranilate isomerase [Synergistaceae bacterium]
MAVKIKVCGLKHLMEIGIANELMPDYIGFVFAPKSRRFIAPEHAAMLRTKLNPKIKVIGVFVNESLKTVGMCADMVQLDAVQLHGNETEEYVCTLREYIRCDIINAFKVTDVSVIDRAVCSLADYIML